MSARSTTDRTRRPARVNTNPQETHHEAPHRTRHVPRQLGHVHRGGVGRGELELSTWARAALVIVVLACLLILATGGL